jgi:hypothetical protein
MRFEAQHLLAAWTKWRLVDVELDAGTELDAAEWCVDASGRAAAVPRGEVPPHWRQQRRRCPRRATRAREGEQRDVVGRRGPMAQWIRPRRVERNGELAFFRWRSCPNGRMP